jgi:hypothetical protein
MIFTDFLQNVKQSNIEPKSIQVYPIGENNLEGIKILIDNCFRMGGDSNSNVRMATVDPSLWLGQLLDKHWSKISYVSSMPNFEICKIEDNIIISKHYTCSTNEFDSENSVDEFFEKGIWKTFVLFSIIKYVDLLNLKTSYHMRYADITEKYEERDNKLEEILKLLPNSSIST